MEEAETGLRDSTTVWMNELLHIWSEEETGTAGVSCLHLLMAPPPYPYLVYGRETMCFFIRTDITIAPCLDSVFSSRDVGLFLERVHSRCVLPETTRRQRERERGRCTVGDKGGATEKGEREKKN